MINAETLANLENEAYGLRLAVEAQRELETLRFLEVLETAPPQTPERVVELRRVRRRA